jgi:hypothetical protein
MDGFFLEGRTKLLKELAEKSRSAVKKFWSSFRSVSKAPGGFTGLQDPVTDELKVEQSDMLRIVQNFLLNLFKGTLTAPAGRAVTEEDLLDEEEEAEGDDDEKVVGPKGKALLESPLTEFEVRREMRRLSDGKAEGVDRMPAEALKNAPKEFVKEVVALFNLVKDSGQAPEAWMTGRVVLLHKAGPEEEMGNYRPLTIGVAMAGLYSKVLNVRLTQVVEEAGLLGEEQAGFRKGRAGADNLFVLNTVIWKTQAKRSKLHMAFIDLQKVGGRGGGSSGGRPI